jgi:DNA-binding transcriptional LysR family regulator
VRLTPVGEIFLREARRTLAQAAHAMSLAQRASDDTAGSIRLSFVASAALGPLPDLVLAFRQQHPGVEVLLDSDTTGAQLEALRRGAADVALIVTPLQDSKGLVIDHFREEKIVMALPSWHPLASRKSIQLGQVATESFISFPFTAGPGFESIFLAACQRAGFSPTIVQEVSQMVTKIMLVASGVGVALVPGSFAAMQMPHVTYVPVLEGRKPLCYSLAFATQARRDNPLVEAFLRVAGELKPVSGRAGRDRPAA